MAYLTRIGMEKETRNAYIQLHISIILWGLTAILGKMITLAGLVLVWWRILFTVGSFLLNPSLFGSLRVVTRAQLGQMAAVGTFIMLHWVCFYTSIKYSNASITLSCLATTAVFTALIGPLWNKKPFKWYEIGLGLAILPGMGLMYGFIPSAYYMGILLGFLSAIFAAIFTVLNKNFLDNTTLSPFVVSFVELAIGFLGVSILVPFYLYFTGDSFWPSSVASNYWGANDYVWLLVLSLACTTLPFILSLRSLKQLSAFTTTLSINLEPVYGIVLAWLIFEENKQLGNSFYIGIAIVLCVVALHPILKKTFDTENAD
jgi:drug/metabolite transporter (DMT)-like permease